MIKKGFTLAEVLITLAIIGVIATLTLPTLMTNTAEQQYTSAFKKALNTLSEAGQMNAINVGFDYSGLKSKSDVAISGRDQEAPGDVSGYSLYWLLTHNASVLETMSGINKEQGKDAKLVSNTESNFVVFFNDGISLSFPNPQESESYTTDGINAMIDVNGNKGPNQFTNCAGEIIIGSNDNKGFAEGAHFIKDGDRDSCKTKSNVIIKDRYGVRLVGARAIPNGAAAEYVFTK